MVATHPEQSSWTIGGRIGETDVTMTLAEAEFWDFLRTDDADEASGLASHAAAWIVDAIRGQISTKAVYRGGVLLKASYEWKTSHHGDWTGTYRPAGWIARWRPWSSTHTVTRTPTWQ